MDDSTLKIDDGTPMVSMTILVLVLELFRWGSTNRSSKTSSALAGDLLP